MTLFPLPDNHEIIKMVRIYIFEVTITFVYVSFMKTIHIRMIEKKINFRQPRKSLIKKSQLFLIPVGLSISNPFEVFQY